MVTPWFPRFPVLVPCCKVRMDACLETISWEGYIWNTTRVKEHLLFILIDPSWSQNICNHKLVVRWVTFRLEWNEWNPERLGYLKFPSRIFDPKIIRRNCTMFCIYNFPTHCPQNHIQLLKRDKTISWDKGSTWHWCKQSRRTCKHDIWQPKRSKNIPIYCFSLLFITNKPNIND